MKRHQRNGSAVGSLHPLLDAVNLRLLAALADEPRVTLAALGRRVGLSAPAAAERLQRLREAGIIHGYAVELEPAALGLPLAAFVRVRPGPGTLDKVAALAQQTPQVVECHRVTGEDCFLIKLYAADVTQLEALLDRFLAYGQTTTSIVQSSPVARRGLPVPSA
jgi:Lrp/AsnC family transcriptional regulator, leucine-responsive regulatory protein